MIGLGLGAGIGAARTRGTPILFRYSAGDSLATATFSRASTANYRTSGGNLQSAAIGEARAASYELDPVSGVYKPSVLIEGQRSNLAARAREMHLWIPFGNTTVTANNRLAPDGTQTATRLHDDAANASAALYIDSPTTAPTAGRTFTASAWVYVESARYVTMRMRPQVTNDIAQIVPWVTPGWTRITVTKTFAAGQADTAVRLFLFNNDFSNVQPPVAGSVWWWGGQVEEGATMSSNIYTANTSTTRAFDVLSFPFPHAPQEMSVYVRGIEKGTIKSTTDNWRLLAIGGGGGGSRVLLLAQTGVYRSFIQNGAGNVYSPVTLGSPVVGDSVEVCARIGPATVGLEQSVNGAAPALASASNSVGMPQAWPEPLITLGSNSNGGLNTGFFAYRDVIVAKGTRDLSFFRNLITP